jgi:hypothetical protein
LLNTIYGNVEGANMGYRTSLTFKPLIGHKLYIEYFENEIKKNKPNKYGSYHGIYKQNDGNYHYSIVNGSIEKMCKEVANLFPGITFYGYGITDSTTGNWIAWQLLWNKNDGIFFASDEYSYTDAYGNVEILFDGVSIRGKTYDGEYVHLNPEYLGYNYLTEEEENESNN